MELLLPSDRGNSYAAYEAGHVVYASSLIAGFRIPLPSYVSQFLFDLEHAPASMAPNCWSYIAAYHIWCLELKLPPSAGHL